MKILFDQGTPVPLRRTFPDHTVTTAYEQGWSDLSNGHLLATADGQAMTSSSLPTKICGINNR